MWDLTAHKVVINKNVIFIDGNVKENDSTLKKSPTIEIENIHNHEDSNFFKIVPEHKKQEEDEALELQLSSHERRPGNWIIRLIVT